MNQSFVQVAPDGTGKKIDNAAITLPDASTQYRQTTVSGDPNFNSNVGGVTGGGDQQVRSFTLEDLLTQILIELRVQNTILQSTLGGRDDLDATRFAESLTTFQQTN